MLPALLVLVIGRTINKGIGKDILTHKVYKYWMQVYMPLIGCPVKVSGTQNFAKNTSYIVVINHSSLMDIPVSSPGIPNANKTLAKSSFAKTPLFGYMYKAGSVLVDRSNAASKAASFKAMEQVLKQGLHLCLYPEGTRNKSNAVLQPFQAGAFKLALQTTTPILPAIIKGTNKILPANGPIFWAWPGTITFTFLPPIEVAHLEQNQINVLKETCWTVMHNELIKK